MVQEGWGSEGSEHQENEHQPGLEVPSGIAESHQGVAILLGDLKVGRRKTPIGVTLSLFHRVCLSTSLMVKWGTLKHYDRAASA